MLFIPIYLVAPTLDLSAFKDGLEVIVPQPLAIRVPITGYPTPTAKWSFGDKELTAGDRVSMVTKNTFTELVITPSVRPDKGTYSLTLENDVSSVFGEIDVNVIGMLSTLSSSQHIGLLFSGIKINLYHCCFSMSKCTQGLQSSRSNQKTCASYVGSTRPRWRQSTDWLPG